MAKKNFFEGPLYTITNYIYWFSLSNIYFILLNLLLVLFLMSGIDPSEVNAAYYITFFIVSLPVGPSLTALLSVMGKLVREGDASITKDFFKAYKQNFKQSFLLWTVGMIMITIMLIDIRYFAGTDKGNIFIPIFNAMIIILLIMMLYIFPIISRFYLKTFDIIKLSFYYAVKKFKVTLLNIVALVGVGLLIKTFPSVSIFFFASVACFMIMFYEKDILKEIEEKITVVSDNDSLDEHEDLEVKEIEDGANVNG